MNLENYKKNIRNFSILLGYIRIIIELESFEDVKNEYIEISNTIASWTKFYIKNKNLSIISSNEISDLYNKIDYLRERKLFDSSIGNEKELSDEVLIWYELIINSLK